MCLRFFGKGKYMKYEKPELELIIHENNIFTDVIIASGNPDSIEGGEF